MLFIANDVGVVKKNELDAHVIWCYVNEKSTILKNFTVKCGSWFASSECKNTKETFAISLESDRQCQLPGANLFNSLMAWELSNGFPLEMFIALRWAGFWCHWTWHNCRGKIMEAAQRGLGRAVFDAAPWPGLRRAGWVMGTALTE